MKSYYQDKVETNLPLFDKYEFDRWKNEWRNMPEFVQEGQAPYAQVIFRFANKEDLYGLANLIGQKLTNKTKSAWYPQIIRGLDSNKRYVDES